MTSLLRTLYLLFAVAAGGRCVVQWSTEPAAAATLLTTVACACYLLGHLLVRRCLGTTRGRSLVRVAAGMELLGVVGVGALDLVRPGLIGSTVWSGFGMGYAFVPAIIPVLMMVAAARAGGSARSTSGGHAPPARRRAALAPPGR